jgi:nucleoside-diphosphate-sugar epimerase
VQLGSVEDLDCLRRAAADADGAIHTAFYHKVSHVPFGTRMGIFFGGAPGGIVPRFMMAAVETDRLALETIGKALSGTDRPLVGAFATMAMKEGQVATEDEPFDPTFFAAPRAETENLLQQLASQGVRTSAIRLPPTVHGAGDHGFIPTIIKTAQKKKESGYVGDGMNRWPAVHRLDAARLFRLALENGPRGGTYHGVAEEGIPFRDIANLIGRRLKVPVVSKSSAEAEKQFTFLAQFVSKDNPVSSKLTQERLGWKPTHPGLLADLDQTDYFKV